MAAITLAMHYYHKTLYLLSFFIFFSFFNTKLFAQYQTMREILGKHKVTFGEILSYTSIQGRASVIMHNKHGEAVNYSYTYTVLMKDSTIREVDSKFYFDEKKEKAYLLFIDEKYPKSDTTHHWQRIFPGQTQYITRTDKDPVSDRNVHHSGVPTDSCWMFNVMRGPISLYSYVSEESGVYDALIGIQKDDELIKPFNLFNLQQLIVADEKAMKLFLKKEYLDAIEKYNKDNPTRQDKSN